MIVLDLGTDVEVSCGKLADVALTASPSGAAVAEGAFWEGPVGAGGELLGLATAANAAPPDPATLTTVTAVSHRRFIVPPSRRRSMTAVNIQRAQRSAAADPRNVQDSTMTPLRLWRWFTNGPKALPRHVRTWFI